MIRPSSCLGLVVLALIGSLLIFDLSDIDMQVQSLFYATHKAQWLIDKSDRTLRFIFYDGIKLLLLGLSVALLIGAIFFTRRPPLRAYKDRLWLTLVSIALILGTVSGLKATTNVACPGQLTDFGGSIPYVRLFDTYPPDQRPAKRQRCFPAGHASGGFALLSLVLLFKSRRNRYLAAATGLLLGWLMGSYKMLIGDHFLSHTVISMLLAVTFVCVISRVADRHRAGPRVRQPPEQ